MAEIDASVTPLMPEAQLYLSGLEYSFNTRRMIFDRVTAPVALVVCLTLTCTVLLSQLIGGLLPVVAEKLKIDPAVMASPLITTIVDTTTLLIYFNIAKGILKI